MISGFYHKNVLNWACILVIDLLNVADVHVVQHVAALGQDFGEASEEVQHGQAPFDKCLLI